MRVDELRRAGERLRNHPPVAPTPVGALQRRAARRRRRQRAVMAMILVVGLVGGAMLLMGVGDRPVADAPAEGDGTWASTPAQDGEPAATPLPPGAVPLPRSDEPSQSLEDAARDRVHPDVAKLPDLDRSDRLVVLGVDEGYWVLSRAPRSFDQLGDPQGDYGVERIFLAEYGEILLLDATGRIVRAYPMPGLIPTWLHVTEHAVYAGRTGDGGLPASSLVRIERDTLEATVIVFPRGGHRAISELGWLTAPVAVAIETFVEIGPAATGTEVTSWIGRVAVDLPAVDQLFDELAT